MNRRFHEIARQQNNVNVDRSFFNANTRQDKNWQKQSQKPQHKFNKNDINADRAFFNINTNEAYNYIDKNPIPGVSYYKLRQVDYNDNAEVFRPVSVIFKPNTTINLNITPNPAIDMIHLEVADQDATYFNHHVRIYDIEGNEVYNKLYIGENFNINIDVSKFKKGSYIVSDRTNKANAVGKFIKK